MNKILGIDRRVFYWAVGLLGCGGVMFMALVAAVVFYFVFFHYASEPRLEDGGRPPVVVIDEKEENAAEHFIENYRTGLGTIYRNAGDKADAGEFSDIVEARAYIKGEIDPMHTKSFAKMKSRLNQLNGSGWSNSNAAAVFDNFSEGLLK